MLVSFALRPLRHTVPHRAPKPVPRLSPTGGVGTSSAARRSVSSPAPVPAHPRCAGSRPAPGVLRRGQPRRGHLARQASTCSPRASAPDSTARSPSPWSPAAGQRRRRGDPPARPSPTPRCRRDQPAFPNRPDAPEAYLLNLVPTTAPQDAATTGWSPPYATTSSPPRTPARTRRQGRRDSRRQHRLHRFLARRIPVFFAAVLALSFLLLMVVFRSLLVPLKAVIMNLLSIGATYSVLVVIFQWGWVPASSASTPGRSKRSSR